MWLINRTLHNRKMLDWRGTFGRETGPLPLDFDNLVLWLRSDTGVTLNGSTVSVWANQGSLGGTFAQGTAASQPTYSAADSSFNNYPSLSFDDTNDFLASSLAASSWNFLSNGTGSTIAICCTVGGASGDNEILSTADGSGNGYRVTWQTSTSTFVTRIRTDASNDRRIEQTGITVGTKTRSVARFTSGSNFSMRVNGNEGTAAGVGTPTPNAAHTLAIGSILSASAALPFGGKITEIIGYNRHLTDSETTFLESYLSKRYF